MLNNYDGNDSLVRHLGNAPAPSLLARAEINRNTQRAIVRSHQLLDNHALDVLEDHLYHQRVDANLDYQADEVQRAVDNARRTPEAEPYLRSIIVASSGRRTRRLA